MATQLTGRALSIQRNKDRIARNKSKSRKPTPMIGGGGSARGDDFAPALTETGTASDIAKEEVSTDPREKSELRRARFDVAGGGSPTVMTNANKIERVIPLLDSKAGNLSSFNLSGESGGGGTNFSDTGSDSVGAFGDDQGESFDEILGLTDKKKKKKTDQNGNPIPELSPMEQQQMALLDQMSKTQDKRLRQSISNTKRKMADRKRQQEDVNAKNLNAIKQVLNLGGSARYSPISSTGLVSDLEAKGIQALADLDAEEAKTIGEIQDARATLDYQTMEKKFDYLDKLRTEKSAKISEFETAQQEAEAQTEKDTAIAELISQGITDPVEMFQALNTSGELNVPLSEITATLSNLSGLRGKAIGGTGFELDNKALGMLLGSGWTAPDIQAMQADLDAGASIDDIIAGVEPDMQQAVKDAFGVTENVGGTPVTVGKGAKTELEENLIRTRLFSKIAPILNKGTLSDADRAIIDQRISEFRDAGMGEQEILDAIAGIPPEVTSPYNSRFRDLIISNSETTEKQAQNIGKLSQQLASGNHLAAMNTVENLALGEAKKLDPDGYIGTATVKTALEKVEELNKLLAKADELPEEERDQVIGPVEGFKEGLKGKFRSKEAQELRTKIAALVADMRNRLSGTAVTESEAAFLEPLIPSLTDKPENFRIKVRGLGDNTLTQYNSVRSSVSLPEVTSEQVINPKKRLSLYSSDTYLPKDGNLDI